MDTIPDIQRMLNDGNTVRITNYPKKYPVNNGIYNTNLSDIRKITLSEGHDPTEIANFITPVHDFFVRKHFECPNINVDNWRLKLEGLFKNKTALCMEDIKYFEKVTRVTCLECTGNQRFERFQYGKQTTAFLKESSLNKLNRFLDPIQFPMTLKLLLRIIKGLGITGGNLFDTGLFTGVKLFDVLKEYPLQNEVNELVFEGIDCGHDMLSQRISNAKVNFARSFEIQELKNYDPILAFEMNGASLTIEHGYPLRLIIPGVYGAEQVKWLGKIVAVSEKYKGYFQNEYYGYKRDGEMVAVHEQRPKSMVIKVLKRDSKITVYGVAWRGRSPIAKIEVSIDNLRTWVPGIFLCKEKDNSWMFWKYDMPLDQKGKVTIVPRVTCTNGDCQPLKSGRYSTVYGNNSVISAVVKL